MVRKEQGTILVLDIGRNVSEPANGENSTFFEEARKCAARIIERKIMSQGKSLLGVLLMGSKKTKNNMAAQCEGAFTRIDMQFELQEPSWKMLRELPEQPSNKCADWLDALAVAAEHLISGPSGVSITNRKIILITNFLTPTSQTEENFNELLKGFVQENIEVDIIGPDLLDKTTSEDYVIAQKLVDTTNGSTAPFSDTMNYLLFHRKKQTNPAPWNVDLQMGPNIRIPVSVYIRLKDEPIVNKWSKAVKDPITAASSTTEAIIKEKVHINVENQAVVEPSEMIKGITYGEKIIPFSKCDEAMLYKSGDKCLSVYGFTNADNITWQNLNGECLYYVFGRKGNNEAQNAIRCLVECLQELKLVGIVRKVHNKNNTPKMFALMPVIDSDNYVCLSMVGICFKEEIKRMAFPPTELKKFECNDKQVSAFKDLIRSMNLMNAYEVNMYDDDTEAFPTLQTVSPTAQYMMDCIAYRAMNPGKPLPPPQEHITMLFNRPPLIEMNMQRPLEQIKNLFTLTEKTTNKKTRPNGGLTNTNVEIINEPTTNHDDHTNIHKTDIHIQLPTKKDEVTRIGTLDPVSDFNILTSKGKSLKDLSVEMADSIESLVYCNLDNKYLKALNAMKCFRDECVKQEPSLYNDWINVFRSALIQRKKYDVMSLISEKKLGVILKDENEASPYEIDEDEEQLFENDTIPETLQLTIQSDINDLYDDL